MSRSGSSKGADAVHEVVDDLILREALRQLDSIDCDHDNWRIDPLPRYEHCVEVAEERFDVLVVDRSSPS